MPTPRLDIDLPLGESWHQLSPEEARARLQAPGPLETAAAVQRLQTFGRNQLAEAARRGPLARLLGQLSNFLIYVLLAAALITALLGHWMDTVVILAVVVIQTLVGFLQEGRAEQALAAIRHMLAPQAMVLRSDGRHTVAAAELVPGDTLLLEPGDRVPADVRLERVHGLQVDEAILTGESMAVDKTVARQPPGAALGDQRCMAFAGTMVTTGTAQGVVVRTGQATELGRISGLLGHTTTLKTPLLEQIDRFARYLSIIIIVAAACIFLAGSWFSGMAPDELFMAVVGLTVAAIPEGLPAILTITLAIGVRRMALRKAVVRRMPVIETLGAVSVICSDKTGTLTRNEMTVTALVAGGERYEVTGTGYAPDGAVTGAGHQSAGPAVTTLAMAGTLCNDAHLKLKEEPPRVEGDPMEGALKVLALKVDNDLARAEQEWPRRDEVPFDADYRFMATLNHDHHGHATVWLKGAPEQVLALCTEAMAADGGTMALDAGYWQQQVDGMAAEGLRVLAFARLPVPPDTTSLAIEDVRRGGLQLLGVVGFMDPPRPEAIRSIADCHQAGIRVKMITGDHARTAGAIAARLGLRETGRVLTGADLDKVSDDDLVLLAAEVDVFARTSPEHKLRLVRALQTGQGVVAMTGDGVNDAPALKRADVGIAMGVKGSEAAREASSMVLLDDNFASIAAAVREGRTVYDNLRKAIAFLLPVNGGESVSLVVALLLGLTLPISALQILWVNLVSSVVLAMTLAFERTEDGVMKRPPRGRTESLLQGFVLWRVLLVSLLFLGGIFAAWFWAMARTGELDYARTMAVNTLVAMEVFYLFAVRYLDSPSITLRGVLGTPVVLAALLAIILLQSLFTWLPWFNRAFGSAPLDLAGLAFAVTAGVAVLLLLELETALRRRWFGGGAAPPASAQQDLR